LWGGLHGVYLVGERLLTIYRPAGKRKRQSKVGQIMSTWVVFTLVVLAWVPFRTDLSPTFVYWGTLLSPAQWLNDLTQVDIIQYDILNRLTFDVFWLVGISIFLDIAEYHLGEFAILKSTKFAQAVAINVVIFSIWMASLVQNVAPTFVYQGF
jgi:hypothetical protein